MRSPIATVEFPPSAGVYIVWAANQPSRPLYIGVAATQTIKQRWRRQHLLNRAGGSALRRSLGLHLGLVEKKLSVKRDGRFYPPHVERKISEYLRSCEIEFVPADSAEQARELEEQLIEELRPLLNRRRRVVPRTAAEKALLREAATLYEDRLKPAFTAGLLAVRTDARLDPQSGYVLQVEDNLLPELDFDAIKNDFVAGAGNELGSRMLAPWSSSALAVNAFAPWSRDPQHLELANRIGFKRRFMFEARCPNRVSAIPPHLDVLLLRPMEVVAVESKCTEFLQGSNHEQVAQSYRKLAAAGDERASSSWYRALDVVEKFLLLDGYQLVKHYLGLRRTLKKRQLTLVYLYWEPANALSGAWAHLFERHRQEVEDFALLVDDDETCRFIHLSYPEWWAEQEQMVEQAPWLSEYLHDVRARYLVEI